MMIAPDLSSALCLASLKLANSSLPRLQETSVINCKTCVFVIRGSVFSSSGQAGELLTNPKMMDDNPESSIALIFGSQIMMRELPQWTLRVKIVYFFYLIF